MWKVRTGSPWRDLPREYGNWNSVFLRFNRCSRKGVFERIFKELSTSFGLERAQMDGTGVLARAKAADGKEESQRRRSADPWKD